MYQWYELYNKPVDDGLKTIKEERGNGKEKPRKKKNWRELSERALWEGSL